MQPPSETELKQTGIGKLVNKIHKKEMPKKNSGEQISRLGGLALEIVEYWKGICKS